jgi:hypothetical protein
MAKPIPCASSASRIVRVCQRVEVRARRSGRIVKIVSRVVAQIIRKDVLSLKRSL